MMGYLNRPEDTAQAITEDGWLRSGDVGHVGEGGFLFVSDRVKDMIITGGENVYSPEVEQIVAGHPAVADVAVIGIPDDHWGETVQAVVVLRPGHQATEQEIIRFARERLAHYKCPRTVEVPAGRCSSARSAPRSGKDATGRSDAATGRTRRLRGRAFRKPMEAGPAADRGSSRVLC
jgi:acyl-CoA synthetase (AMP-forming)/AMP-acid ligase II